MIRYYNYIITDSWNTILTFIFTMDNTIFIIIILIFMITVVLFYCHHLCG